jgi:hypothetical protein
MMNLCYKRFSLLLLVVALTTIPFLNKPVHIDDPFVLRIAENVIHNPFDPFAGSFDWFGKLDPIFEATTNPPLMSYFLAPFAYWSNQSEIVMHSACLFFYVIFAYSMYSLGNRFGKNPFLASLFVMSSTAVVVSGNVMRDVPAAALATLGIALFIHGTDEQKKLTASFGAILCGLALVTKYSSIVTIPVLLLYPLLKRKYLYCLYATPSLLVLAIWCVHNQTVYGSVHMVYLLMERSAEQGIGKEDKWWGALVILSSSLYLFPLLIWSTIVNKKWLPLVISILSCGISVYCVRGYFDFEADVQFLFWTVGGTILIVYSVMVCVTALKQFISKPWDDESSDTMFLFAWFMAPFLFSILFVPFQAVRHLILALPPLAFLSFRIIDTAPSKWWKPVAYGLFVIQLIITLCVQYADYEFANVYRRMANEAKVKWVDFENQTWFTGHWGWQFYMNRSGFKQVRKGDLPRPGDYVLVALTPVPEDFPGKLALLDEVVFKPSIPITVMNFRGASFYALLNHTGTQNLPYRFYQDTVLESIKIYEVKSVD